MNADNSKKAYYKTGDLGSFIEKNLPKPLIVILGLTGSGKTELSLKLAEYLMHNFGLAAEIINSDSRQFYKGMDIGTAKISEEEKKWIPHHLFSVLEPHLPCSIFWYQKEVTKLIDRIHRRNEIPMLVGGSMLYISSIIDGLVPLPTGSEKTRLRLEEKYETDEGVSLHNLLKKIDPVSADAIPRQNKKYLIRALEICEGTGQPKSELLKKSKGAYSLFIIGTEIKKDDLALRIKKRTEKMFEDGWTGEVKKLIDAGYGLSDPGMLSTGYREIYECLKKGLESNKEMNNIIVQTLKYSKRQMTWWKRDLRIRWMLSGQDF